MNGFVDLIEVLRDLPSGGQEIASTILKEFSDVVRKGHELVRRLRLKNLTDEADQLELVLEQLGGE